MKKLFYLFLLTLTYLSFIPHAYAVNPTTTPSPSIKPSGSPTPSGTNSITGLDQQIDNLKERIASRVAQLNLVQKKAFIATVTDVSETQLTVTDQDGNTRFVDVDELTHFSSPSAKTSFGISDITKGSTLGILGLLNRESRRTLARFVDVLNLPKVIIGAVSAVDTDNNTITVTTSELKDISIDVTTVTKTYAYEKTSGLTKSGFSKIQQGERVTVVGYPDAKNKNMIVASRIIRTGLPINPKIPLFKPGELQITPATGSGNKLVPIIKAK